MIGRVPIVGYPQVPSGYGTAITLDAVAAGSAYVNIRLTAPPDAPGGQLSFPLKPRFNVVFYTSGAMEKAQCRVMSGGRYKLYPTDTTEFLNDFPVGTPLFCPSFGDTTFSMLTSQANFATWYALMFLGMGQIPKLVPGFGNSCEVRVASPDTKVEVSTGLAYFVSFVSSYYLDPITLPWVSVTAGHFAIVRIYLDGLGNIQTVVGDVVDSDPVAPDYPEATVITLAQVLMSGTKGHIDEEDITDERVMPNTVTDLLLNQVSLMLECLEPHFSMSGDAIWPGARDEFEVTATTPNDQSVTVGAGIGVANSIMVSAPVSQQVSMDFNGVVAGKSAIAEVFISLGGVVEVVRGLPEAVPSPPILPDWCAFKLATVTLDGDTGIVATGNIVDDRVLP